MRPLNIGAYLERMYVYTGTFYLQTHGVWCLSGRCIATIYFYRYTISLVVVHILYIGIRWLLLYESGKQENEEKKVENEQRRRWMCLCGWWWAGRWQCATNGRRTNAKNWKLSRRLSAAYIYKLLSARIITGDIALRTTKPPSPLRHHTAHTGHSVINNVCH